MRSRFDRGAYHGVRVLFLTTRKSSLNYSTLLGLLFVLILFPERASAQRTEPRGSFLQLGTAALGGYGLQVGYVNAKDFFTREVLVLGDVSTAFDPGQGSNQVALMFGGALRVFGFERTIGNVPTEASTSIWDSVSTRRTTTLSSIHLASTRGWNVKIRRLAGRRPV